MWYVIQTMSGQEHECIALCRNRIERNLYNDIFVPMYTEKRRCRGKWHDLKKVLFPGYFFVDTDDVMGFNEGLKQVDRFTSVLKSAERMSPIYKQEQEFLMDILDDEYTVPCSTGLIIGDSICITDGPLMNYHGLIKKIDRHKRKAGLEVEIFGRMTPAEVGLEVLAKISEEEFNERKKQCMEEYGSSVHKASGNMEAVKIVSGLFEGMEGQLIAEYPEKNEYKVSIDMFESPTVVTFRAEEILR